MKIKAKIKTKTKRRKRGKTRIMKEVMYRFQARVQRVRERQGADLKKPFLNKKDKKQHK